jgi:hypothetical protein
MAAGWRGRASKDLSTCLRGRFAVGVQGRLVGSNGSLLTLGEVEDVAGDGGVSRHARVELEEQEEEVEEKHEGQEEQQAHQKTAIKEEPATNGAELHAASVDGADKAASAVDGQSTVPVAAPAAS